MFDSYSCPLTISIMNQVSSISLALAAVELDIVPGVHPYRILTDGLRIDLNIVKTATQRVHQGYNLCVYPIDLPKVLDLIDINTTSLEILKTGSPLETHDLDLLIKLSGVTVVNRSHNIQYPVDNKHILLLKGSGGAGLIGDQTIEQLAARWAVSPSRSITTWFSGGLGQRGLAKTLLDRYPGTRCSIGTLAALTQESPLSDWAAKQLLTRSSVLETAGQRTARCIRWGTGNTRNTDTQEKWNQTALLNSSISAQPNHRLGMIYAGILDQTPIEWLDTRPTLKQVVSWILAVD